MSEGPNGAAPPVTTFTEESWDGLTTGWVARNPTKNQKKLNFKFLLAKTT